MTDPSLVSVLQRQTQHKVGLVQYSTVVKGAQAVREAFQALRKAGIRHAVLDSITDEHLLTLGEACADLKLVTGGSGMAMGLPANFVRAGLLKAGQHYPLPKVTGADRRAGGELLGRDAGTSGGHEEQSRSL